MGYKQMLVPGEMIEVGRQQDGIEILDLKFHVLATMPLSVSAAGAVSPLSHRQTDRQTDMGCPHLSPQTP